MLVFNRELAEFAELDDEQRASNYFSAHAAQSFAGNSQLYCVMPICLKRQ